MTGTLDYRIEDDLFMASKFRYTPLEAEKLCHKKTGWKNLIFDEAFARYGRIESETEGTAYCWILDKNEYGRCCPVWIFRKGEDYDDQIMQP